MSDLSYDQRLRKIKQAFDRASLSYIPAMVKAVAQHAAKTEAFKPGMVHEFVRQMLGETSIKSPGDALIALQAAMQLDTEYAWSWHCNLAMLAVDAGAKHYEANVRAADFMKSLFNVDTRLSEHFPKVPT